MRILKTYTDENSSFSVLTSGRPDHFIVIREEATEGGYDIETQYVHISKFDKLLRTEWPEREISVDQ